MKKFILALFILFLPFQLRLPQLPVINTVNFFLILLMFIFIFGKNPNAMRSKFDTPLLIFLLIWIISFIHTLLYPAGIWRFIVTVEFKRLITLVLAYFVFARCLKTKEELRFLFCVLLISIVLVGLHTWRNGMLAGMHFANFKRSSGPFALGWRGADIVGGFLAIFTPFLLAFSLLVKKKVLKLLSCGGVVICLMGIFATYSRGSILALAIASIVTILVALQHFFKSSKFSIFVILAIFLSLTLTWKYWVPQSIVDRIGTTVQEQTYVEDPLLDQSSQGRIHAWKSGLEIFKISPIIGVGFKIPEYALSYDTHNTFIQITAEMGIFGILVFLWFLWRVFRQAGSLLNTEFVALGAGFIGCIIAFIFVNMFYSNFFRDTVVGSFWIALGMLAASKSYVIKHE